MPKTSKSAFYYPSKSSKSSSSSPGDKVNDQLQKSEKKNNAIINLTEGKISKIKLEELLTNDKAPWKKWK